MAYGVQVAYSLRCSSLFLPSRFSYKKGPNLKTSWPKKKGTSRETIGRLKVQRLQRLVQGFAL